MKSSWKLFFIVEILLFLFAMYQVIGNTPLLIFIGLSALNLVYALKKRYKTSFNQFQIIASIIVIILCLLSSPAVWFMLVFGALYFGLIGLEMSGIQVFGNAPWNKKQIQMVKTTGSEPKSGKRYKRPWIGNERFGNDTYEWDDINFSIATGDTVIDLGNTLLPKEDNVIIIRKGFGRTRIIVPTGIGVMLEHSSMRGSVQFDQYDYKLRNESVKLYSGDYDQSARKLKIITNTLFGDLEVLRV